MQMISKQLEQKNIPKADVWCFGAPCQSFSVAGKRAGLDGTSGLVREIFRLLNECEEKDRPEWLIYENVKGMFSSNKGWDYAAILSEMEWGGYDIEWQNINSKWFVPQNRERIYTVGHLRRFGSRKIFPIKITSGQNSIQIIGHRNGYRRNTQVFSEDGITETLDTGTGGGRGHHVAVKVLGNINPSGHGMNGNVFGSQELSSTLTTNKGEGNKVAIPVLTPERAEKRQNGRRFKENGEPMFTLTSQDRHGVAIEPLGGIYTSVSKEYQRGIYPKCSRILKSEKHDCGVALGIINPQGRTNKAVSPKDTCPTLRSETHGNVPEVCLDVAGETPKQGDGIFVEMPEGFTVYAVWYEKYQCYIAIRKLTPKECFRLQGWSDDYFEKAAYVNSDSQLYKQAGNGVTVSVVEAIAKQL